MPLLLCCLLLLGTLSRDLFAADTTAPTSAQTAPKAPTESPPPAPLRPPTLADVPYGTHARQVLDFWRAPSDRPTPLVLHIHGGGWVNGDKAKVADLDRYLAAGLSVVSINYRFVTQAIDAGVKPPVQWPLEDAVRALQFVRSQARAWNLDPKRIGATGASAGACSSLYLAFHADLANPASSDPVARESTRLDCAAVFVAQTTLDPRQMIEWTPNSRYGGHAFGFMPDTKNLTTRDTQFAAFLAAREELLPWIQAYSPWEHISADDPPIYLLYRDTPALGQPAKDPTHTANFGVKLEEKLRATGVPCELVYPGGPPAAHPQIVDYLIARLSRPDPR
ncbi:MAG: alpha/beta hydrolase [Opitutaceae bacterium]|nr:alpha/beta hydrolase [Opitutaceae bacterium]